MTLRGPEGSATVDRSRGERARLVIDRHAGRIRGIVRHWPGRLPPALAPDRAVLDLGRGLPRFVTSR